MWHNHQFSQVKNISEGEGWRRLERGVGQNFQKMRQGIQRTLHNIKGVRNPLPTMSHKDVFWKKGELKAQEKSLKRIVQEFRFSNVGDQKTAT